MPDMRKEFPAQAKNRLKLILETARENQFEVTMLLLAVLQKHWELAHEILSGMHKTDRDALLYPDGFFNAIQLRHLTEQDDT